MQFINLRAGSRAKSKIKTLHFKKEHFSQFRGFLASVRKQQRLAAPQGKVNQKHCVTKRQVQAVTPPMRTQDVEQQVRVRIKGRQWSGSDSLVITQLGCSQEVGLRSSQEAKRVGPSQAQA